MMLGTSCAPCCGKFIVGLAFNNFTGPRSRGLLYHGWEKLLVYSSLNPASVDLHNTAGGDVIPSVGEADTASSPRWDGSLARAKTKVTYSQVSTNVNITVVVDMEAGRGSFTIVYEKPLTYFPDISQKGTYEFTAADIISKTVSGGVTEDEINGDITIEVDYVRPRLDGDWLITQYAGTLTQNVGTLPPQLRTWSYAGLDGVAVQLTYPNQGRFGDSSQGVLFCDDATNAPGCGRSVKFKTCSGSSAPTLGRDASLRIYSYGGKRVENSGFPTNVVTCKTTCETYEINSIINISLPAWKFWGQPTGELDTGVLAAYTVADFQWPGFIRYEYPPNPGVYLHHGTYRLVLQKL